MTQKKTDCLIKFSGILLSYIKFVTHKDYSAPYTVVNEGGKPIFVHCVVD